MRLSLLTTIFCTAALVACASSPAQTPAAISKPAEAAAKVSRIVDFSTIGSLDFATTQAIAGELPGKIDVENGVELKRLVYRSQVKDQPIEASALVAVPENGEPLKGVVIFLRGSDIPRSVAPLADGAVWTTEASVYAGNGFAMVLPEYIGMGASPSPQAFLITDENVADFRSALTAAHEALSLTGDVPLYVTGFSQGGQLSAALHRDLEAKALPGFDLQATVSIAGPHELVETFERRLFGPLKNDRIAMGYVSWAAYTFAWHEDRPLDTVFRPDYADRVADWFGGDMTVPEILVNAPGQMSDFFAPAFLASMKTDDAFWFVESLKRNETYDWAPKAPLRVVMGEADTNVDPVSTRILHDRAIEKGGNVGLLSFPGLDHMETNASAYVSTLAWFEALAAGEDAAP